MERCRETDYGEASGDRNMLGAGKVIKRMAMEYIQHKKAIIKVRTHNNEG